MSLPHYKMTMLAITVGIATAMVGCSSNPKKDVVDTGPKSSEQAYLQKAERALENGQYSDAVQQLQALETYYPTSSNAAKAQLDLLYAKFQQKDFEGAIALADRFIRLNPQHPNVDYAYYVRGVANMEQNYSGLMRYTSLKQAHRDVSYIKVAYQNFVDLVRRFPTSPYGVDAAQRMQYIGQELAEHEMNAARFNLKRKAYLAAVERSLWVIEHYPNTPQNAEALATVAYGYNKLGDKATAQQYIEILKLNYPNLVQSNGEVNLRAARSEGSWFNRATLGIFGKGADTNNGKAVAPEEKRSLTNRLSFGLLDRAPSAKVAQDTAE
jgi:outer membrane protein assembly factor BamD